ncbi:dephospho-CoA kinase [Spiroplasma monobiae]|uniref:Dephospho-CoA kinase n=1 Tax=Spiroplasma monobiae MQ-1 TaxID=1336748 RepID=A0A2K9LUG3_SPISQ|nr:dephospho-CoA kinase [Spiroplasma monobiae]AUM62689.1 dephospho-CoA kinase [Spiroplasma monobiae MQ-1]
MKIIGVSGFIGSGKSTMLEHLVKNPDFKIIEADKVSKDILYDEKIIKFISKKIPGVLENGKIDRSKLRTALFGNHKLNNKFTKIAWPLISNEINKKIKEEKNAKLIFVEAAVISGIKVKFDKTILLIKDHKQRIDIVNKRDNRKIEEIDSITEFQRKKLRKYKFDFVLENNLNKEMFYKNIDNLIEKIREDKKNGKTWS